MMGRAMGYDNLCKLAQLVRGKESSNKELAKNILIGQGLVEEHAKLMIFLLELIDGCYIQISAGWLQPKDVMHQFVDEHILVTLRGYFTTGCYNPSFNSGYHYPILARFLSTYCHLWNPQIQLQLGSDRIVTLNHYICMDVQELLLKIPRLPTSSLSKYQGIDS